MAMGLRNHSDVGIETEELGEQLLYQGHIATFSGRLRELRLATYGLKAEVLTYTRKASRCQAKLMLLRGDRHSRSLPNGRPDALRPWQRCVLRDPSRMAECEPLPVFRYSPSGSLLNALPGRSTTAK